MNPYSNEVEEPNFILSVITEEQDEALLEWYWYSQNNCMNVTGFTHV